MNTAPSSTRIIPGLVHDVWQQDKSLPKYPKLTSDEEADVIVVGAGIAGLSIAYNLVQAGKKVIVLERYSIGESAVQSTFLACVPGFLKCCQTLDTSLLRI